MLLFDRDLWFESTSCSVHKELGEENQIYRFDLRGIDLVGVQKCYPGRTGGCDSWNLIDHRVAQAFESFDGTISCIVVQLGICLTRSPHFGQSSGCMTSL